MYDFQSLIFRSASHWSEVTGLVVFCLGLLYTLQGFRFVRFLVPLTCMAGGILAGGIVAGLAGLPSTFAFGFAAIMGIWTLARYRIGLRIASAFTFGALAQYMVIQCGLPPNISLIAAAIGLIIGFLMVWLSRRALPILVTILPGAGLLVVGFVGLSSALAPSLGLTFVDWSTRIPLMVPGLMAMLCVLGYSVQANTQQGDIETGGSQGLSDYQAS